MTRPLEVSQYGFFKNRRHKKFLLAVSGGLDSMALVKLFEQLAPKLDLDFTVAHIHHGPSLVPLQQVYRDDAFVFLKEYCAKKKMSFMSNIHALEDVATMESLPDSEAALRTYRKHQLEKMWKKKPFDFLVFGHHADDLFETRLLRMIRGTGPQGLASMSMEKGPILRPFLKTTKNQLREYLQSFSGPGQMPVFFADPSNEFSKYLRNWLRNEWLPALESRQPGAVRCLQQSTELILAAIQKVPSLDYCFDQQGLLRSEYLSLTLSDKRRVWALYLKRLGLQNYGLSHINELVKRLDVEQKDLTFRLLKKRWLANARHIWCESKNAIE